ncbi:MULTISPECIES: hypothetical protein [Streptomyces]|uniref:Peptidase inhibitor family I36 n=2 Tax=Streptomyces TaxID=1883 RepID=A0ABU4KA16_9ACTN|nr:hypothetical protein [Streptomyces roseolus]MDX2294424.1 hypothetical protein [Streptomyces roseolus]
MGKGIRGAMVAAMAAASLLFSTQSASAVAISDNCDVMPCSFGDLHLYYNSIENDGYDSARASFYGNIPSYAGGQYGAIIYTYVFGKNSSGYTASGTGKGVKNAAASAQNCAQYDSYRVYYNSSYQGASQYFNETYGVYCAGGKQVNLNSTLKNQNASQHFA